MINALSNEILARVGRCGAIINGWTLVLVYRAPLALCGAPRSVLADLLRSGAAEWGRVLRHLAESASFTCVSKGGVDSGPLPRLFRQWFKRRVRG
jgi:hypothetical protein